MALEVLIPFFFFNRSMVSYSVSISGVYSTMSQSLEALILTAESESPSPWRTVPPSSLGFFLL